MTLEEQAQYVPVIMEMGIQGDRNEYVARILVEEGRARIEQLVLDEHELVY